MAVKVIGLDTAKHVFQVHGADRNGRAVLRKRLKRNQVSDFFANLPKCLVGLEATRGAHYWARVIGAYGHEVRLIAPQFVKPYVKGQKNDAQDAAAICEAVGRPEMRFVPQKSVEQQDLQALHRIRSRLIGSRTQLGNQIRGLLAEYGIILPLPARAGGVMRNRAERSKGAPVVVEAFLQHRHHDGFALMLT
jgi:transposase